MVKDKIETITYGAVLVKEDYLPGRVLLCPCTRPLENLTWYNYVLAATKNYNNSFTHGGYATISYGINYQYVGGSAGVMTLPGTEAHYIPAKTYSIKRPANTILILDSVTPGTLRGSHKVNSSSTGWNSNGAPWGAHSGSANVIFCDLHVSTEQSGIGIPCEASSRALGKYVLYGHWSRD